jgi:hypothetical protein
MRRLIRPQALGVDVSTVLKYASKLPTYAQTIAEVIDDPYLPEFACRVDQLYQANHKLPIQVCNVPPVAAGPTGGIGLRRVMPVVRAYVYSEQHAWVLPVAAIAAIGLPILIGYRLGASSRKSSV